MKDENLEYIGSNFLTIKEIARESGRTVEEIQKMNVSGHLPEPSYVVTSSFRIESPLGDSYENQEMVSYYPRSLVELIRERDGAPHDEDEFLEEMRSHLSSHADRAFAFGGAADGSEELETALRNELSAFRAGVYGICTIDATPQAIVEKEIAAKKLIEFDQRTGEVLSAEEKIELEKLVDAYDSVSSMFAPYQREESSRGKYVDRLLIRTGREDKIKKYH